MEHRSSSHHDDSSHQDSSHHDSSSHHHRRRRHGGVDEESEMADDPVEEAKEEEDPPPASCWDRLRAEINPCQPWFLKTHPAHDRPLDITTAFAPEGCQPLFFKVFCGAFVWFTAVYSFVKDREDRQWWFAYMTNWMLFAGSVYFFMSVWHTLFGASQPYKRVSSPVVKFTWLVYSFSSHFSFLVAIFWWLYIYERGVTPIDWLTFCPHTIIPFTITFDGLNVNRIPLRWQHYIGFVIPMECLYVFWTWIQNDVAEIDNPNILVNTTDDDAIYEAYNWEEKGVNPLKFSAIGIFGFGPFIWFLEWMFSQYWLMCCCLGDRRLYYSDPRKNRPNRGRVEGAGLSSMRRMSFDEDDVYSDDGNEEHEDEHEDGQPKKYRNKLEELADRASSL